MKFSIKNKKGLEIVGDVLIPEKSIGLIFVLHGLGGARNRVGVRDIAETFFQNQYTVVNFDVTNASGESGGRYEDATIQLHYEDLVAVIDWSKTQDWYHSPFMLAGHSLGGYAVFQYAEDFPEEVQGVFGFAATISGTLSFEARERFGPEELKKFRETGWESRVSKTTGRVLNLPFSHLEERLKHDLVKDVKNLTMPILMVVGEKDTSCPPDHQKMFFDLIPGKKELHIVFGAPHTFRISEHLDQLKEILTSWVHGLK